MDKETFKAELLELMSRYHVRLVGADNYDREEDFAGTDYDFMGEGWTLPISEIVEE